MIEACLNSRPLNPRDINDEEIVALTPDHFLIETPLTAPPEPFIETNETKRASSQWQLPQLMHNHFRKQ